jgi:hypothetical protein
VNFYFFRVNGIPIALGETCADGLRGVPVSKTEGGGGGNNASFQNLDVPVYLRACAASVAAREEALRIAAEASRLAAQRERERVIEEKNREEAYQAELYAMRVAAEARRRTEYIKWAEQQKQAELEDARRRAEYNADRFPRSWV